ncbi:hypothetical protein BJ138DRAFT_984935, partial [Hygrophoropsis aurantiaca]
EAKLLERFPLQWAEEYVAEDPLTIVDSGGIILLWYLPQVLTGDIMVELLRCQLQQSIGKKPGGTWQQNADYFQEGKVLPTGSVSLSPQWFQQGHDLDSPEVSLLLKHGAKDNGARPWLSHMAWINSFTAATLYVMHPNLYKAGREVMVKFGQELDLTTDLDGLEELLPVWGSVFNAVSVISNRETPLHRD